MDKNLKELSIMTDKELREFAVTGVAVRLEAEKKKLSKHLPESQEAKMIEARIKQLTQYYEEIIKGLI